MTAFDSNEDKRIISKKRKVNAANGVFLVVMLFSALMSAAFATMPSAEVWLITGLVFTAVVLAAFVLFHIFIFSAGTREINKLIAGKIYSAFIESGVLSGSEILFTADYDGDEFSVVREGFLREIKISGTRGGSDGKLGTGGSVKFDLSGIKNISSVYSSFGERILQFLQAYYYVHCDCERAVLTDRTDSPAAEILLVADGAPVASVRHNYFIKNGVIQ